MPRPDRAVDHGLRLADRGACVPWDAMAAIERAQADAATRRLLADAEGRRPVGPLRHLWDRLRARRGASRR